MHSGYATEFSVCSWGFGDDFAWYVLIISSDKILSIHDDKYKSSFLLLSQITTDNINCSIGTPDKKVRAN